MSALREVRDAAGVLWTVFEVSPRGKVEAGHEGEAQNWLCFAAGDERRRLQPVPARWAELPVSALLALLEEAGPTGRRRRYTPPGANGITPAQATDAVAQ